MSRGRKTIWDILGIEMTEDVRAIRRAYATKLKVTSPEDDAEGFQALRQAYEWALDQAEYRLRERAEAGAAPAEPVPAPERHSPVQSYAPEPREPSPPPPGVTQAEMDALRTAFDGLSDLIDARAGSDQLIPAFQAAMRLPALEAVVFRDQAEGWTAHTILERAPAADALMEVAIDAFGWRDDGYGRVSPMGHAVVQRAHSLQIVAEVSRKGGRRYGAWKALTAKPKGLRLLRNMLTPGLKRDIDHMMGHPNFGALADHVDADALAWWTRAVERRSIWLEWLITAAVSTFVFAAYFQAAGNLGAEPAVFWPPALGLVLAMAATGWAAARFARPALLERFAHNPPRWFTIGWIAPALISIAAALLVPASMPAAAAVAGVGLIALAWAMAAAEPEGRGEVQNVWLIWFSFDLRLSRLLWSLLALIPAFLLFVAAGVDMNMSPAWAQMGLAAAVASLAFAAGQPALRDLWLGWSGRSKVAMLTGVIVLTAMAPFALWASAPGQRFVPALAVLVAMFLAAERVMGAVDTGRVPRVLMVRIGWFPLAFIAVAVEEATGQANAGLLFAGLWVLSLCAIGLVSALREELQALRRVEAYA